MNKLSHSAATTYQECPKKWQLRYKDRLYPVELKASLLFGTALDEAGELYINTRDTEQAIQKFIDTWTYQERNDVKTHLKHNTDILYSNYDLDTDLLYQSDIQYLNELYDVDDIIEALSEITKRKSQVGYDNLSDDYKVIFNTANWISLKNKGLLMLKALIKYVDNNIKSVLSSQIEIFLKNDNGDEVYGKVDFVVEMYDGRVIAFDLKTARIRYEDDAVVKSQQLALYTYALDPKYQVTHSGFIVLNKQIYKNRTKHCSVCGFDGSGTNYKTCNNMLPNGVTQKLTRCDGEWNVQIFPESSVQILIDIIPQSVQELIVENFNEINTAINTNVFPRNLDSCVSKYGVCPYYDYCHHGDKSKLIYSPKKEKVNE